MRGDVSVFRADTVVLGPRRAISPGMQGGVSLHNRTTHNAADASRLHVVRLIQLVEDPGLHPDIRRVFLSSSAVVDVLSEGPAADDDPALNRLDTHNDLPGKAQATCETARLVEDSEDGCLQCLAGSDLLHSVCLALASNNFMTTSQGVSVWRKDWFEMDERCVH